jgi:hypothetical protein
MTSRRIALYSFSLLSIFLLNLPARAQAGEPKYKGVDCGTLPTRTETADCTAANFQVKTIFLGNAVAQIDANEILVDVRNMESKPWTASTSTPTPPPPSSPEVVEAMRPFWSETFGNPSSAHQLRPARPLRRRPRPHLHRPPAQLLRQRNRLHLRRHRKRQPRPRRRPHPFLDKRQPAHLITTADRAPRRPLHRASPRRRGIEVTYLAPTREGIIDPEAFEAALRPDTELVSIMFANNETGAIQPIGKLARIAKAYNPAILFHTDAVQAAGKLPHRPHRRAQERRPALSISGHKMYAPQGTGILFVRNGVHSPRSSTEARTNASAAPAPKTSPAS